MLLVIVERELDCALHHHGLAFAFVLQRTDFLDRLARRIRNLFRADLRDAEIGAYARIHMHDVNARFFETGAQIRRLLRLGVRCDDEENLRLSSHAATLPFDALSALLLAAA